MAKLHYSFWLFKAFEWTTHVDLDELKTRLRTEYPPKHFDKFYSTKKGRVSCDLRNNEFLIWIADRPGRGNLGPYFYGQLIRRSDCTLMRGRFCCHPLVILQAFLVYAFLAVALVTMVFQLSEDEAYVFDCFGVFGFAVTCVSILAVPLLLTEVTVYFRRSAYLSLEKEVRSIFELADDAFDG